MYVVIFIRALASEFRKLPNQCKNATDITYKLADITSERD